MKVKITATASYELEIDLKDPKQALKDFREVIKEKADFEDMLDYIAYNIGWNQAIFLEGIGDRGDVYDFISENMYWEIEDYDMDGEEPE